MIFTVVWQPFAHDGLAHLWMNAPDRAAVTQAADSIDRQLRQSPLTVGESRVDDLRVLLVNPLGVYYSVDEDDCKVTVWAVWRTDGK